MLRVNVINDGVITDGVAAAEVAVVVEEQRFHSRREADHSAELADAAPQPQRRPRRRHRRCCQFHHR